MDGTQGNAPQESSDRPTGIISFSSPSSEARVWTLANINPSQRWVKTLVKDFSLKFG